MKAMIDEEVIEVTRVDGNMISDGGREWYVFQDSEVAGQAARERWKSVAEFDPEEFACLVGEETLISWALGHLAGPGSIQTRSLEEWLDVVAEYPWEEFASYDGEEVEGTVSNSLLEELALDSNQVVFYRHN